MASTRVPVNLGFNVKGSSPIAVAAEC